MAHTKAQRAVRGNRDSIAKRLGVKIYGGQAIKTGNIILKQRGTRVLAGDGVLLTKDHALMALRDGSVTFYKNKGRKYVRVDLPVEPVLVAVAEPVKTSAKEVKAPKTEAATE